MSEPTVILVVRLFAEVEALSSISGKDFCYSATARILSGRKNAHFFQFADSE
jgi:hypothetical protein